MGVPAGGILGFADASNPSRSLARVEADAPTFAAMERPVNWAIPLAWPGISTADVASGMYDSTFVAIAETIAENQTEDFNPQLYVRLGWEATNGYPWKVFTGPDKVLDETLVQDYIDAFQHVATLFRSVDDRFQIEWNQNYSNKDSTGVFYDLNKLYPGDDFVDVVGVDAYNVASFSGQDDPATAWAYKEDAPFGLNWFSQFAAAHGKPLALTEWGIDSDGFGYYVEKLAEFARTNNVLYANYWNADARTNGNDTLTDGSKPATAAAIASEFGPEGNSTLIPGEQSGLIVEAGAAADGSPLVGTSSASMWAVKADPDGGDTATFDTAGWIVVDSTHLAKNGIYGSAVLDTSSGVITYTLDNTRAATNALADKASVTDAFSVTVRDTSGASTTQVARFTITGTSDADIIYGSEGSDSFFVDNAGDRVIELFGQGVDTVRTGFTHTLAANVENLELLYTGNASGTGNGLDNGITGNAGNNGLKGMAGNDVLNGAAGNDTIDGGSGADAMQGGEGADSFFVDNAGDRVNELFGQSFDTVRTGFADMLAANVENLALLYTGNASGTGNGLDNRIVGNDVLNGRAGNDSFVFDMPHDAGTNVDVIVDFSPVEDTFLLDHAVFTNSGLGQLEESAFALGEIATNSAQRIVYDKVNGELSYDPDGVGGADQLQFASLTPQLAISSDDFIIV